MTKHKALSLREKVKVIEAHEKEKVPPKLVVRFSCRKTVIYETIKNKDKILQEWFKGTAGQVKQLNARSTGNEDLTSTMWEWFVACRTKGVLVSGQLFQQQALEVAKELGKNDFKASNGWLESFRNCHNIGWSSVCGEAKDIDSQTPSIKRSVLEVRKPNKECVFICDNMVGDFVKPLVVEKAANPRSFKANKKSWLTAAIMEKWLHGSNLKMKNQNRKVLLFCFFCFFFLDNATCHPHIKLCNTTLMFFPANTTSITQSRDQGVIYTLKWFYRKKVLQHLLTEIENSGSLTELAKKITVRNCVYWVARAAKEIRPDSVRKCFAKAGFKEIEKTDDDEDNQPINELTNMLRRRRQDIDDEAVVSFDDDLSSEGVDRAVKLIHNHPGDEADQEYDGENNDEEDKSKPTVDNLKIKSYAEALCAVSDLEEFAASKNSPMLVELMQDATGLIEKAIIQKTVKQQTLMDMWQNTVST
ncbi:hypothetical protein PR048_008899 [Dryococelus australis]|uniref:HTH CENPB-type domain-containing protein n=1 Tax=Dryococelus australis TaxID=614101 RepID=A0ABQ9HYE7_9NEOP|nr:hypothetical protein PR048_008899 [Dryococelus australis]